jgi:hypothetical protein
VVFASKAFPYTGVQRVMVQEGLGLDVAGGGEILTALKAGIDNAFNFVFKFLFPLLGGLGLFFVLIITLRESADPEYGSGASIGGVGLVLILGLGLILAGLVLMAILRVRQPAFFRGKTVIHESAHAMRPHEHLVQ